MKSKKDEVEKTIPIGCQSDETLIPGMLIAHKKRLYDPLHVVYAEPCRDGVVTCIDENGHTCLVKAWDGNHVIVNEGYPKVRIVYGVKADGPLTVTDVYYFSEEDFKQQHPKFRAYYVEALKGTEKIIRE